MSTVGIRVLSSAQWETFKKDIDLIEKALPDLKEGNFLQWSTRSRPIRVFSERSANEYIAFCKITNSDMVSPYALQWSKYLVNKIDLEISTDFLQKLNVVKEAFNYLSQTFEKYAKEHVIFSDAAEKYREARNAIEATCQKHKNSAVTVITEASVWGMQQKLGHPQACAEEARSEREVKPKKGKDGSEEELMIFELEL